MRRLFALLIVALPLAACETADPSQMLPEITFEHLEPLRIQAEAVEVETAYRPPLGRQHIENEAPVPPVVGLETWAEDRLHPSGGPGTLRFTIVEGSLVEQPLKTDTGITGAFKNQQAFRYVATAEAQLELLNAPTTSRVLASAKAERSVSLPEDATLNERDRALFDLVEKLMADFDTQMESSIRRYFADYMR